MSERNGVSFKPRTILRLDGQYIEAPKLTSTELGQVYSVLEPQILERIEELYQTELERNTRPGAATRLPILIARLALHEWQPGVLSRQAQHRKNKLYTLASDLVSPGVDYFNAIESTVVAPEVHIRGGRMPEETHGVWLGVRRISS